MRIIDLSHDLDANMPLYPGTPAPRFEETASIDTDGYRETRISLCVHTGTHVDAPAHLIKGAKKLDQLPLEMFYGEALLISVNAPGQQLITVDDLTALGSSMKGKQFLLLRTDWSHHWGSENYFSGYPTLSQAAAHWLAAAGVKGVGLDTLSADPIDAPALPIHHILLGAGMIIVENLTHLSALPDKDFIFSCLPLKICNADGSPVRAVAVVP